MKPLRWCLAVGSVLVLTVSNCLATGSDTQLWTTIYTTTALNRYFDLLVNGQLRFGRDISALVDERVQTGFNVKICPHLTFSPAYSYIHDDQPEGRHTMENRRELPATFYFEVREWRLAMAGTWELRFCDPQGTSYRFRPKLTLEHPIGPELRGLSGYAADEGFWDSDSDKWVRNRFYAGFKKNLPRNVKLDLYYMRQNDEHANPGDLHVAGIALHFYFAAAERE